MPARSDVHAVALHAAAPQKPAAGAPCNGCGICCAAERCPPALLFLAHGAGPCPALAWQPGAARYRCGLVTQAATHIRWLPRRWEARAGRWFAARIAAGTACDCDIAVVDLPPPAETR